jgi:imidazolonepropionase-like amidohydrolase
LSGRAWAAIDWPQTEVIMQSMIDHGVSYCPLLVACQLSGGDGVAELEADSDFIELFSEVERRDFRAFMDRLSGGWTAEDLACWKRANENRLKWMRRFREMGGTLLVGTDFQWGGITMHQELRNLAAVGMGAVELIAAATGESAKALRLNSNLGTIKQGLLADLVVVDESPLKDLHALRDVAHVLKGGSVVWDRGT